MKRFFGMMPSVEIEKEKRYTDDNNLEITIQAGPHGWTVIYADGGTNYQDVDDTTENNFQAAYNVAVEALGELKEVSGSKAVSVMRRDSESDCDGEVAD